MKAARGLGVLVALAAVLSQGRAVAAPVVTPRWIS